MKKILCFTLACALATCSAFAKDTKGKLDGNDKNPSSRRAQAQAKVDSFKYNDNQNLVFQYTIGDDNMALLCNGQSFFGNSLGFSHFEVDGDRADWTNWKTQAEYLNEEFSWYFSDYDLPDYLGGIYVYNMYGTQYIWAGGEMCNPYDGWRNDCNNTTFFIARTWAQANYAERANRCNFAFWVEYARYSQNDIARIFGESSLPTEFSEVHWRSYIEEVNGVTNNYKVYSNFKLSLHQWFTIVCIETENGLVPVHMEKTNASAGGNSFIGTFCKVALAHYKKAMEAYSAETVVPDEVQPDYYFDNNNDGMEIQEFLTPAPSDNNENSAPGYFNDDQTKESHDA